MMEITEHDIETEKILRPKTFDDYVGQKSLKDKLKIAISASLERGDPLCSILISGQSGGGKSTIAEIIANEYGSKCKTVMAPSIKTIGDALDILTKLERNSFLFVDEIHSLDLRVQETLYSAIESFRVSVRVGNKEIVHIKINPFCLIAATTDLGRVSQPLINRFGITHTLEPYSDDEIAIIVRANIEKIGLKVSNDFIYYSIAKRCRGIPRLANRLIKRIQDYVQIKNNNLIDEKFLNESMQLEGIDENGFTKNDIKYLKTIYRHFMSSPAGINAISSSMNEDKVFIERDIEPFLLNKGFIIKTKSGRVITANGLNYIIGEPAC